jgi:tRNA U38,U39,U40 pseudouridine synthase TruA
MRLFSHAIWKIGTGRQTPQFMIDVLRSAERSQGGPMRYTTAPAHGLYLTDVQYGNSLDDTCHKEEHASSAAAVERMDFTSG